MRSFLSKRWICAQETPEHSECVCVWGDTMRLHTSEQTAGLKLIVLWVQLSAGCPAHSLCCLCWGGRAGPPAHGGSIYSPSRLSGKTTQSHFHAAAWCFPRCERGRLVDKLLDSSTLSCAVFAQRVVAARHMLFPTCLIWWHRVYRELEPISCQ